MPGLVPGIHAFALYHQRRGWPAQARRSRRAFNPQGLTILADVATAIEDVDRAAIAARIEEMEQRVKDMEQGSLLDREIAKLDHFKQLDTHLQTTALH
jgi:hypothetical protein